MLWILFAFHPPRYRLTHGTCIDLISRWEQKFKNKKKSIHKPQVSKCFAAFKIQTKVLFDIVHIITESERGWGNVAFCQMNYVGIGIKNFILYRFQAKRFIMQFHRMDHEVSGLKKEGSVWGWKVVIENAPVLLDSIDMLKLLSSE